MTNQIMRKIYLPNLVSIGDGIKKPNMANQSVSIVERDPASFDHMHCYR